MRGGTDGIEKLVVNISAFQTEFAVVDMIYESPRSNQVDGLPRASIIERHNFLSIRFAIS